MECPFQVGDEVAVVEDNGGIGGALFRMFCLAIGHHKRANISTGEVHRVMFVMRHPVLPWVYGLELAGQGWDLHPHWWFRKAQKRKTSLAVEQFLTIKPDQFEEPKRTVAPAKTRESA